MFLQKKKSDLDTLKDFFPGILKTTTMGYDGKGQYPIKRIEDQSQSMLIFPKAIYLKNL